MEDLNKNAETEKPVEVQNNSNKEATQSNVINAPKVTAKRIRVRSQTKPAPSGLIIQSAPIAVVEPTKNVDEPKSIEKVVKKGKKTEAEIVVKKSPVTEKVIAKPVVKKDDVVDSAKEKEEPESLKVIKKVAKKAKEKVDKLKKKVKKAKKRDAGKSKLKSLKEKLENAIEKFKKNAEKLKEAKK